MVVVPWLLLAGGWFLIRAGRRGSAPAPERQSDVLAGVLPHIARAARELVVRAWVEQGVQLIIAQGYRSRAQQDDIYAQGRTRPGPIVSDARPGRSWHQYGRAVDVAPVDDQHRVIVLPEDRWQAIGAIGERLGFEWGGRWANLRDFGHFQWRDGLSIDEAARQASRTS